MYTEEDLAKYKYFDGADPNFVLDSLTGVISRQYILDFARNLIINKIPFTMSMMDLDNFKYINDSYGHDAGDKCLRIVAENLQRCTGDKGLVGRFGGDEFVIINLKDTEYDDIHLFFEKLYGPNGAVRRSIYLDKVRVFITATIGSAVYPKDSDTYEELFKKMDKALYRGKSKGRNCFIIYVHEKHKDIEVNDRGQETLLSKCQDIKNIVKRTDKDKLIHSVMDYLYRILHTANVLFVNKKNIAISAAKPGEFNMGHNLSFILSKFLNGKDLLSSSNPQEIKNKFPDSEEIINNNRIHAFVVAKVKDLGYIVLYENAVTRMWQDYDLVLINYAITLLDYEL